ncbi:MAG: sulfite exporter TauE/SafE family protein [Rheinheimera sp.]
MLLTMLAALFIGLCLGLFGSGGSIMTVPVLLYLLQMPEKIAIASALGIVAFISLVALMPYLYRKHLQWALVAKLAFPGILGAWLGSLLSHQVAAFWQILLLALLMSFSAINMWRQQLWRWPFSHNWQLLALGTLLGAITGFVGVGGGFLIVPLLLAVTSLTMAATIATSLLLIFLQTSSGFISHYLQLQQQGIQLDLKLIATIGALGAVGSLIAMPLSQKLPQPLLRRIFAVLLFILGMSLIVRQLTAA